MKLFFRLLARLPLGANHALGAILGRLVYRASPRYRRRLQDNLRSSGIPSSPAEAARMARANAGEIGKSATEIAWALFRPDDVAGLIRERIGWEETMRLRAGNRPILFVTPHLGAYDIAGRYLWTQLRILAMYRPHKIGWIDRLLREGRNSGAAPDGSNVAPATVAGVRMVLKHLKRGGCTVVLPDQVPGQGDGEWADFFGRPAHVTLIAHACTRPAVILHAALAGPAYAAGYPLHRPGRAPPACFTCWKRLLDPVRSPVTGALPHGA